MFDLYRCALKINITQYVHGKRRDAPENDAIRQPGNDSRRTWKLIGGLLSRFPPRRRAPRGWQILFLESQTPSSVVENNGLGMYLDDIDGVDNENLSKEDSNPEKMRTDPQMTWPSPSEPLWPLRPEINGT